VIKIAVAYESDPSLVRDILTGIACTHPQMVQSPPPAAFLVGFGERGLEFELRGVVLDIENGLSVRSELNYAIVQKFREIGISFAHV
jgi:small-conductance mechanosensitive channel